METIFDDLEKTSYYLVYVVVIQLLKSVVENRSNKSDKRIHLQKLENENWKLCLLNEQYVRKLKEEPYFLIILKTRWKHLKVSVNLHNKGHGPLPVIHTHQLWGGWEIWKIASNKVFHFEVWEESLLSQLGERVELFIDRLWGASHPLTSKPTFKVACEAAGFKAICILVVTCKKYMILSNLRVQKMIFVFVQVLGVYVIP